MNIIRGKRGTYAVSLRSNQTQQSPLFFLMFVFLVTLSGCAVQQQEMGKVVYSAPPPPKQFDLELHPGQVHLFRMNGEGYAYNAMKAYINAHKREVKGLYSVLFHVDDLKKDFHKIICFDILMMDTGVAGYLKQKAEISPAKWTVKDGGSRAIQIFYRQCKTQ